MKSEEEIFEAATGLPETERTAYLDAACLGRPGVRARLDALVHAHDASGFMEARTMVPDQDETAGQAGTAEGYRSGDSIGRFRLIEPLGEGGFGFVWMAEQTEPIRRQVALKIIKAGMDTREIIARFEAERQALARMEHPHIARVLDAGATETRRPYFVMELVRGERITDYCDQRKLPTNERLRLFIQVCQAVQHAHQKGVIHRDLKPSNILVSTGDDGSATPKVIDFGVAKAIGPSLSADPLLTGAEQIIGTPAYMSPEQTGLGTMDIDARSDVYSLGALLYELLTGGPPFGSWELLHAGFDEMRRIIREVEPPSPSTRLGDRKTTGTTRSESARGGSHNLIANLRRELDWIVMKALAKERSLRYETVDSLAQDVARFLRGEPVLARSHGLAYRAGKLVRRHKGAAAAAAAVLLALLGGLAVSLTHYFRERKALGREILLSQEANVARQSVLAEAGRNARMAEFLDEFLSGVDEKAVEGEDVALEKKILDLAAARMISRTEGKLEVEAKLRQIIERAYHRLGLPEEALPFNKPSPQPDGGTSANVPPEAEDPLT